MPSVRSDVPLVPLFSPSILIVARAVSLFPSSLVAALLFKSQPEWQLLQQIITVRTTILVSLYTFYIPANLHVCKICEFRISE